MSHILLIFVLSLLQPLNASSNLSNSPIIFEEEFKGFLKGNGFFIDNMRGGKNRLTKEQFEQKARKIHGDKYGYELVDYKNNRTEVQIFCKNHNDYFPQKPENHLNGRGCSECGSKQSLIKRTKKTEQFLEELKQENNYFKNNLFDVLGDYKNAKTVIICKDKYGLLKPIAENLLSGFKPSIRSAVNPTEYFINQCTEVHGDKYIYSKTIYINDSSEVEVICPLHGSFWLSANNHLGGHGCCKCSSELTSKRNRENPTGWGWKPWKKKAEKSKNFDSFKLYIVRLFNENESFFKIGRTFLTVKERFKTDITPKYNWEIVKIIESKTDAKYIWELERDLKRVHRPHKHTPKNKFDGMYECFTKIV